MLPCLRCRVLVVLDYAGMKGMYLDPLGSLDSDDWIQTGKLSGMHSAACVPA